MSARTRRSLTFFWTALFVLSMLMQYASFAAAPPVAAVHDEGKFELDGNALDQAAAGDDWAPGSGGTPGAFESTFITDGFDLNDDIFTGGKSKDPEEVEDWLWKAGSVQDKDDIEHAFAAAYTADDGDILVYFGLDRYQTSGTATAGFWFFKSGVSKAADGTFNGTHTNGDILVVTDFSNGGATATAVVYEWLDGDLVEIGSGLECGSEAGDDACAIANEGVTDSPWVYDHKGTGGADDPFAANAFFEGGINLTALGLDQGCFSSFLAETRSSNSETSTLSDFALGQFAFCVDAVIETDVSDSSIAIGSSVTDTASLSGIKGPVTGTVKFFVCGPNGSQNPDCSTGGSQVGGAVTIANGEATSAAFTPTAVGNYCFRAEYTPAQGSKYLAGEHTNLTTECFEVVKRQPAIETFAEETVGIGSSVSDSATLTGGTADAGGTVTFRAYGPSDSNCSGNPAFTSSAVPVTAGADNDTYGPVSFTPTTAGTYRWIATYSGDAKNAGVAGACNAAGENDVVSKAGPTVVTRASASVVVGGTISDTATLAGGNSPTGTITFNLYGPDDATCAGNTIFTDTATVTGNGDYSSDPYTATAAGTYRWIANYGGDANNEATANACNAANENVVVTKQSPTISTVASGTVDVGGAISDTATLAGGFNPTGTITFDLYGPDDATCSGAVLFSDTATVNGNGDYPSDSFSTTKAGTYRWIASYGGDANNDPVGGSCNDANESVVVTKASPSIATILVGGGQESASITVPLGTSVHDTSSLTGSTADAGGTVHYEVFMDNECQTKVFDAGTKAVVDGVVGESDSLTVILAGTYYWQATYSGDANNDGALSPCNLEVVTVPKNIPGITTSADETVTIGAAIHDSAELSGTFSATGTITFKLYGPDDATCANDPISTQNVNVAGNGTYGPVSFTPTAPGAYRWVAVYGGDVNNAMVSGACNDAGETDTVVKEQPSIVTDASATVVVGGSISDTAQLQNASLPTSGTVTFKLYGPNDPTCSGTEIFTSAVAIAADGSATSGSFATSQAGTYRWIASYSGDANNEAASGACNDANEDVEVTPASPAVDTQASATVTVGGSISDTATLSGGVNPTGTITFELFGPDNADCSGDPIFTDEVTVDGNDDYTSAAFATSEAGIYRWIANYSGDANNTATANECNEANENVEVTKANPAIATVATMGGREGDKVSDVATVSGGFNPTGTVTFTLYGPNDFECDGSAIFTDEVALEADGTATSGAFTVTTVGTYLWIASYSGDANNQPAAGECGDEGETTIIEQFAPTITTVLHADGVEPAPKLTVLFGTAVQDQAILADYSPTAGGTITFTVYSDDECTDVLADAGTKTVIMGTAPWSDPVTFDVPGTYYWQAEYSGDANNAPAISECTDEVLTVTSPDLDVTKLVRTGSTGDFGPTSVADPGDVLEFQITIENGGDADAEDVPVSDDLADLLAHATYNDDCNLSCTEVGTELHWTVDVPAGGSVILTFSVTLDDSFPAGTTHLPNVVVVTGPGSNCPEASTDPDCDTDTTVQAQPAVHVTKLVRTNAGSFGPTSTAQPGDTLTFQITITNSGNAPATNVPVEDDIADLLDHATYNDDCSDSCEPVGTVLEWTIASIAANGGTEVLTFSVTLDHSFPVGTTTLPNVVVVIAPGSNCPAQSDDPDCDTTTTVDVRTLTIDKSFTGNTGGTGPGGVPEAKVGDVLTFTLAYDVTNPPVHNGVITDVLPAGLAYVDESASDNDEFTFTSFAAGTRTLRWDADVVSKDGFVTYQVLVLVGSDELPQPLVNTATIDSDETEPDSDTERVFVEPVPLAATGTPKITLPPTSTIDAPQDGSSNAGFSLMLVLLGLAGFVLVLGLVTPVPARARRRDRR